MPLAGRTTLGLGGAAEYLVDATDEPTLVAALSWAGQRGMPVTILGGGSNVVIADAGLPGLTIVMAQRGVELRERGDRTLLEAAAGEPWDALVEASVARGLAGLECLSGIPGLCGATPIQNVGAYGQEVSQCIEGVRVLDRQTLQPVELSPDQCEFAYRDSAFKRRPDRYIVLSVRFALVPGGAPTVAYPELARALSDGDGALTLGRVREQVLSLRRGKSMVIDPHDENRRSVGSFFHNPIVDAATADRVVGLALAESLVASADEVPRFPDASGGTKLSAGWLIERAGMTRGLRRGGVGISSRHALSLVHHGGGTTRELIALACEVRAAVVQRFGITLSVEPTLLGCDLP